MKKGFLTKKIFLLFLLVNFFNSAFAYINIYPVRFDKNIDTSEGYENYSLYNSTNKTVRYRVYIDKIGDERKDMSEWVEYYPKSMTLKPGETQNLKVQIKAPKEIKQGEYFAILGVKEVPIPNNSDSREMLEVLTDLRLEIAGFVGDIQPKLNTKNIKLKIDEKGNILTKGIVQNIGNRRGNFEFYIINSNGKERHLLGEKRLLQNREIDLEDLNLKIKNDDVISDINKFNTFIIKEKDRSDRNIKSFIIEKVKK